MFPPCRTMAIGQFFNGLAGPVTQAGPPVLSSLWFPPSQRTTATALSSLTGSLGIAVSFLIGTLIKGEAVLKKQYNRYVHRKSLTCSIFDKIILDSYVTIFVVRLITIEALFINRIKFISTWLLKALRKPPLQMILYFKIFFLSFSSLVWILLNRFLTHKTRNISFKKLLK